MPFRNDSNQTVVTEMYHPGQSQQPPSHITQTYEAAGSISAISSSGQAPLWNGHTWTEMSPAMMQADHFNNIEANHYPRRLPYDQNDSREMTTHEMNVRIHRIIIHIVL